MIVKVFAPRAKLIAVESWLPLVSAYVDPPKVAVAVSPTPTHVGVMFTVLVSLAAATEYVVVIPAKLGESVRPLLRDSADNVETDDPTRVIVIV